MYRCLYSSSGGAIRNKHCLSTSRDTRHTAASSDYTASAGHRLDPSRNLNRRSNDSQGVRNLWLRWRGPVDYVQAAKDSRHPGRSCYGDFLTIPHGAVSLQCGFSFGWHALRSSGMHPTVPATRSSLGSIENNFPVLLPLTLPSPARGEGFEEEVVFRSMLTSGAARRDRERRPRYWE